MAIQFTYLPRTQALALQNIGHIPIPRFSPQHTHQSDSILTRIGPIQPHLDDLISIELAFAQDLNYPISGLLAQPRHKALLGFTQLIKKIKTEKSQIKDQQRTD